MASENQKQDMKLDGFDLYQKISNIAHKPIKKGNNKESVLKDGRVMLNLKYKIARLQIRQPLTWLNDPPPTDATEQTSRIATF